jgi:hypothetical protein
VSKRAVWIIAIVLVGLSGLSIVYSLANPNQIPFDQVAWISASSEADYARRNQMVNDIEKRIDNGELNTDDLIREKLGQPDQIDSATGNWYYRLGSPGGQSINRRLELGFEKGGRILSRRVVSEE